jgi:hypothetical protein
VEGLNLLSFDKGPSAHEWARSADVATPIKWGDLEKQIISERLTPNGDDGGPNWLLGVLMVPIMMMLGAFLLAPALAAGLVAWATVVSATWLSMWWQTRSRSVIAIVSGLVATVSVVVTFIVGKSYDGDLPGDWLEWSALVTGVLGLALTILQFVSKSEHRAGVPKSDRAQRRYSAAREEVLDVLVERGVVDLTPDQRHRMRRMRVGTWHKFDAQGRV